MERAPSDSYSLTIRVKLSTRAGTLGEVTTAIGRAGETSAVFANTRELRYFLLARAATACGRQR